MLERLAILNAQIESIQARLLALRQRLGDAAMDEREQTLGALLIARVVYREHLAQVEQREREPKLLHIAESLRIVGKHRRIPGITIRKTREIIQGLAAPGAARTRDDQRLVAELEERTRLRLAELASLAGEWLPRS
jgi:hypothetical protein